MRKSQCLLFMLKRYICYFIICMAVLLMTEFLFNFKLEGQWQPRNKVCSLNPAKRLLGLEPTNCQFICCTLTHQATLSSCDGVSFLLSISERLLLLTKTFFPSLLINFPQDFKSVLLPDWHILMINPSSSCAMRRLWHNFDLDLSWVTILWLTYFLQTENNMKKILTYRP